MKEYIVGLVDGNDYAVPYTLHGAPNKYTYQPFNTASGGNITGAITSTHVSINT